MEQRFCTYCGTLLKKDCKYCTSCGKPTNSEPLEENKTQQSNMVSLSSEHPAEELSEANTGEKQEEPENKNNGTEKQKNKELVHNPTDELPSGTVHPYEYHTSPVQAAPANPSNAKIENEKKYDAKTVITSVVVGFLIGVVIGSIGTISCYESEISSLKSQITSLSSTISEQTKDIAELQSEKQEYSDFKDQISNLAQQFDSASSKDKDGTAVLGVSAITDTVKDDGTAGAQIVKVTDGGAAENAGIEKGDLVTSFDGKNIATAQNLVDAVSAHKSGDQVEATVYRNGVQQNLEITLK